LPQTRAGVKRVGCEVENAHHLGLAQVEQPAVGAAQYVGKWVNG